MGPVLSYFPTAVQKQQEHLAQPNRSLIQVGLTIHGWFATHQEAFVAATRSGGHEDNLPTLASWHSVKCRINLAKLVAYKEKAKPRKFGLLKGKIWISDDFNDEDPEINKLLRWVNALCFSKIKHFFATILGTIKFSLW